MPQPRSTPTVGADLVRTLEEMIAGCPHDTAAIEAGCRRVEALARRHLLRAFQDEGVFLKAGDEVDVAALQTQLRVGAAYERLFHVLLDLLVQEGAVSISGGRATVLQLPDASPSACLALREAGRSYLTGWGDFRAPALTIRGAGTKSRALCLQSGMGFLDSVSLTMWWP